MNEQEMREAEVPTPHSLEELSAYIDGLTAQNHDYGTCVYAMSMAATAAFNYVAHKEGVTGFQASCADMDVLRRTRRLKGPFMLVDLTNHMYPQYDLVDRVHSAIEETSDWYKEEAQRLLDANTEAVPSVIAHWQKLAGVTP